MKARCRFPILAVAPFLLLLATCAQKPQTSESRANQATVAACRQRAEEVYLQQNRDQLYQSNNSVTPYSGGPTAGLPTRGLSALYAHDSFIDDCVRNTGTQTQRNAGSADTSATPPQSGPAKP